MSDWSKVRKIIKSKRLSSRSWASDRQSLLAIVDKAEQFGLDSTSAERAPLSNLRTIIKSAKASIAEGQVERLGQLFEWAATLTTSDLRTRVGSHVPRELYYRVRSSRAGMRYELHMTPGDFERMRTMTKSQFTFILLEDNEHRSRQE